MINALFIGGPADGRRMQLGDHVHRISVPEMPRLDSMVGLEMLDNTIPAPIKDTEYHRHDLLGLPGIAIFTVGEMATINIVEYLIDGYKAEAGGDAEQ